MMENTKQYVTTDNQKGCIGGISALAPLAPKTQAVGLTDWNADAPKKVSGFLLSPDPVLIKDMLRSFQARRSM
jgi:hypothetical protein